MGYGTYGDDFDKTGGTINVSGPLTSDEDYQAYITEILEENPNIVVEVASDGDWNFRNSDDPTPSEGNEYFEIGCFGSKNAAIKAACDKYDISFASMEEFSQKIYDDFNEHLISSIEDAGDEVGLKVVDRSGFRSQKSNFDMEFVGILDGRFIGAGWRSWQHDFVVGVGAADGDWKDYVTNPSDNAIDIIDRTGHAPEKFVELYEELSGNLQTYLTLSMLKDGIECNYKTGSYTSAEYKMPEDADEQISTLKKSIVMTLAKLNLVPALALASQDASDRIRTIRAIDNVPADEKYFAERRVSISVPLYDHKSNVVLWVNPYDKKIFASSTAIDSVAMTGLPEKDGLSAIPRNEETESWFKYQQEKTNQHSQRKIVVASAQEYVDATANPFAVIYDGFAAEVEAALLQGQNLAVGAGVDVLKLKSKCQELVAGMTDSKDERSAVLREGLTAVLALTSDASAPSVESNKTAIKEALDLPEYEEIEEIVILAKSPSASLLRSPK